MSKKFTFQSLTIKHCIIIHILAPSITPWDRMWVRMVRFGDVGVVRT